MDKKKTILIAVLINGGVLLLLFIAALTMQKEEPAGAYPPLAEKTLPLEEKQELEGALASLPLLQQSLPEPELPLVVEEEAPLQHKLPPLAKENLFVEEKKAPPPPNPKPAPKSASSSTAKEIVVKKGDSLEKIAKAHNTTVDALLRANQLASSFLKIGQVLKIPEEKTAASKPKPSLPSEKSPTPEYYTVKVGDNPWTIAMKHHLKVEQLLELNGLNEEKARKLKPGDRLRIR